MTGDVADLCDQLTGKRRSDTVHVNHNGIFRQLLGKSDHLRAQGFHRLGQHIELGDGGLHQHLRRLVHREHRNEILCLFHEQPRFVWLKVVAVPMTPLAVTLCKGRKAHSADIIDVPKRTDIIHPFLRAVRSGGAFKIGVGTGIDLIDEGDEIVLAGRLLLHAEGKLPIQGFELCTCGIHACMLTQIDSVVKGIPRNLLGISFIRLDLAQRVVSEVLDELWIDGADEKVGGGKPLEQRLVVTPRVLHDDARICTKSVDKGDEFLNAALGVEHLEEAGKELSTRRKGDDRAFALGDINTDRVHVNPSKTIDL